MNFKSNKVTSAIVNGTKVSVKASGKGLKATGVSIKDGTLYVTDHIEIGVGVASSVTKDMVIAHNNAKGDRQLARLIKREERQAAKAVAAQARLVERDAAMLAEGKGLTVNNETTVS